MAAPSRFSGWIPRRSMRREGTETGTPCADARVHFMANLPQRGKSTAVQGRPLDEIYLRLKTSYMTLEDIPANEAKFGILLDLINYCEDQPGSSLEDYREFKALAMEHGPFPRDEARWIQ